MILGQLYTKKFEFTGDFEGEWVELKPLTADVLSISESDPDRNLKLALASIHAWSVTDKNNNPVPVTMLTLKKLELRFFNEIVVVIGAFQNIPKGQP